MNVTMMSFLGHQIHIHGFDKGRARRTPDAEGGVTAG